MPFNCVEENEIQVAWNVAKILSVLTWLTECWNLSNDDEIN